MISKHGAVTAQRVLAAYDSHIGWEHTSVRGARVTRPIHDPAAIRAMMEFAEDWRPTIFIAGGDMIDCGCVSHWNAASPGAVEGFRLKDELDEVERLIVVPVTRLVKGRKIWLTGNHEAWIDQLLDRSPALIGMISVADYLRLSERGWEVLSLGEIARVNKCHFTHGESVGSGVYGAKRAIDMYGRNIVIGHHHTYQTHIKTSAMDENDFHSAIMVPGLCRRNPRYGRNRPNAWLQGFLCQEIHPTGYFSSQVHILVRGKFLAGGKLYGGVK